MVDLVLDAGAEQASARFPGLPVRRIAHRTRAAADLGIVLGNDRQPSSRTCPRRRTQYDLGLALRCGTRERPSPSSSFVAARRRHHDDPLQHPTCGARAVPSAAFMSPPCPPSNGARLPPPPARAAPGLEAGVGAISMAETAMGSTFLRDDPEQLWPISARQAATGSPLPPLMGRAGRGCAGMSPASRGSNAGACTRTGN
jgi:hypothetical protein